MASDDAALVSVHGFSAVVRDDRGGTGVRSLGVIGTRNRPIQNEDHAELICRILQTDDLELTDAGYVGSGQLVFMVSRVADGPVLGARRLGDPRISGPFELVSVNHHDGSGALWFYVLPAGIWRSSLRPLFAPDSVIPPKIKWIADQALSRARVRHDARRDGIAGKLRLDLRLEPAAAGPLESL